MAHLDLLKDPRYKHTGYQFHEWFVPVGLEGAIRAVQQSGNKSHIYRGKAKCNILLPKELMQNV